MLAENEDYENLAGLTVTFGYLFDIENHGLEALFKVITDKGVHYFAAQKSYVIRLNFNEHMFNDVTEQFLAMNS